MSNLASQFKKTMMAHTFLECVNQLLTVAHASLAKDPCLAVTAIFQTWLQWFKTAGSGVEWPELATVKRECCQLYKQYKREEWAHPFDVHFALVNPSLEFLMYDFMAGMTVSAPAVASASETTKHPVGVEEGEGDVEMRETTPLVMVAEVEWEQATWRSRARKSSRPPQPPSRRMRRRKGLRRLKSDDKGPGATRHCARLAMTSWSADFDERVAGVEWQFQRELEAAKEELLVAWACYTVAK
ncbi:hypothetical protein E4T56_gene18615 [Termitomyces sp. T112]|nr:hypothetical protein E4T56_gene18615 [Termitomyces sp. T112]